LPSSILIPSTVFSRRWFRLANAERVRIEVAFDGGQIMGALVTPQSADALEQALVGDGAKRWLRQVNAATFGRLRPANRTTM